MLQLDEFQSLLLSTRVHTINLSYKFQLDFLNLKYNFLLSCCSAAGFSGPHDRGNMF